MRQFASKHLEGHKNMVQMQTEKAKAFGEETIELISDAGKTAKKQVKSLPI
jgi:hypothetical protein